MARPKGVKAQTAKSGQARSLKERHNGLSILLVVALLGIAVGFMAASSPQVSTAGYVTAAFADDGCSDSDGVDFYNWGSASNFRQGGQKTYSDYCASTLTLAEYYCSGIQAQLEFVDCPDGCINGKCR